MSQGYTSSAVSGRETAKIFVDSFIATEGQEIFTLSYAPIGPEYLNVSINGVMLDQAYYNTSGSTLYLLSGSGSVSTLDGTLISNQFPRLGDKIRVQIIAETAITTFDPLSIASLLNGSIPISKLQDSAVFVESFTSTESQTVYTLEHTPRGIGFIIVSINGVVLDQSLYTLNVKTLTLLSGAGSRLTVDSQLISDQLPKAGDKVRVQIFNI